MRDCGVIGQNGNGLTFLGSAPRLCVLIVALCALVTAAPAEAQDQGRIMPDSLALNLTKSVDDTPTAWQQFTGFIASALESTVGKMFVLAILVTFLFSVAIVAERFYFLYIYMGRNSGKFARTVEDLLQRGKYDEARLEARVNKKSPLGRIFSEMLDPEKRSQPSDEYEAMVANESTRAAEKMTRNLPHLHMLANVSTLLGLLGTIVGLMIAFGAIANLPAAERGHALTNSIALAMSTTAFGLIVAIPNLVLHSIFSEAATGRTTTIEESVNRVLANLESNSATE